MEKLNLKKQIGIITIILLSLFTLFLYFQNIPPIIRFASFETGIRSLGQLTGLLGLTLYTINIILIGRYKFLEKYFKGLDEMYKLHHHIGVLAFLLILFHPILLSLQFIRLSFKTFINFLIVSNPLPIILGKISLFIMILVLAITLFTKINYETKRKIHKLLGFNLILITTHILLVSGELKQNQLLKTYLIILCGLAILSFTYKNVLGKFFKKKTKYVVESRKQLSKKRR